MSITSGLNLVEHCGQYDVYSGLVSEGHEAVNVRVKKPHELVDPHAICVAPGYSDGTLGPDRMTNYFAEEGRLAFTLDHPRSENEDTRDDPEGHKAENLRYITDFVTHKFNLNDKVDTVGHSEGAANSTRFAVQHPEMVRTVTVAGAAGMIEHDTQTKIALRSMSNIDASKHQVLHLLEHPVYDLRMIGHCIGYIASNPKKAWHEALKVSSIDIRYRFPILHIEHGIPTASLEFLNDALFPPWLTAASTQNGRLFVTHTLFPDSKAGHLTPQHHPRRTGKIILDGIGIMLRSDVYNREHARTS